MEDLQQSNQEKINLYFVTRLQEDDGLTSWYKKIGKEDKWSIQPKTLHCQTLLIAIKAQKPKATRGEKQSI